MTTLIATSVVRGSEQGESHGGVYLVDLDRGASVQTIDWNTTDIDWQGRGWDRGLRGIAFDGDTVWIAASDELFAYDRNFQSLGSYRCRYLKHCHEISAFERRLYLTSTGFDALLGFDLDEKRFCWGLHVDGDAEAFRVTLFDPLAKQGPAPRNRLHLNNVTALPGGLYLAGLNTSGLLKFNGRNVRRVVRLPEGAHNARPFRDGVLFNDSAADAVRFETPKRSVAFPVPRYKPGFLTHAELGDPRIARQGFGRGLCVIGESLIAAGSSPSTISIYDVDTEEVKQRVNLSRDIRNAIHGLEVWPYD